MERVLSFFIALIMAGIPLSGASTLPQDAPTEQTDVFHSEWYIPDLAVEDVIIYFNEVCLDSEYSYSGNSKLVQKWNCPIYYELLGTPTKEDVQVIEGFCQWLNNVPGFPGIYESSGPAFTNLEIYFCPQEEIPERMGDDFHFADGAVTYWYEENQIYSGIICCRSDIGQYLRNSVILEEMYNGMGAVQDTVLRPDSLIYQYYAEPQAMSEVDELIMRLLYSPYIDCGMDAEQCEAVIRRLYY